MRAFWEDRKGSLGYIFCFFLFLRCNQRMAQEHSAVFDFSFHSCRYFSTLPSLFFFSAFLHKVAASLHDSIADTIAYLLSLGRMNIKDCPLSSQDAFNYQ